MSRPPHHPYTSRRYRPVREAVQRLPPAGTVHHLEKRTDHQNRQTPRPSGGEQDTVGQRRNAEHLPELAAVPRTDHRLAHPPQSQTRSLPRTSPQPAMAHHPNSSHQPTNASSTSDPPTPPPAEPPTPPRTPKPARRPQRTPPPPPTDPKHPPHKPQPAPPHQHSQLAEPDNQQAPR